jgi:hypothetical protein
MVNVPKVFVAVSAAKWIFGTVSNQRSEMSRKPILCNKKSEKICLKI